MKILSTARAVLQGFGLIFGLRGSTEEPRFTLLATLGPVQIRAYAPRLAASVSVTGDEIAARSAGFRILAGFIFGANTARSEIAMTAPVVQSATAIAMTAPVVQAQAAPGEWRISFFMPAKYSIATLPRPRDQQIEIHELPAETQAVYRFSGLPTGAAVARARNILTRQLAGSAWQAAGEPTAQFYDPPWTLPWCRRSEAAVPVTPRG